MTERKKPDNHMPRTYELLREQGFTCQGVEKKAPKPAGMVNGRMAFHLTTTIDLFGCIDVLAVSPDGGIIGLQVTDGSNVSHRVSKSLAEPRLVEWLKAGGRYQVWGWSKRAKPINRKWWQVRRIEMSLRDGVVSHWEMQD